MKRLADALFAAQATRARTAKVEALAGALRDIGAREPEMLAFAARLLTGVLLPVDDPRTLGTGGALLFEAACKVTGQSPDILGAAAGRAGDLGTAIGDAMPPREGGLALRDVEAVAEALAGTGSREGKLRALTTVLEAASPLEARYLVRAILGEMRVGAKEGIVEEAIGKAFGRDAADVRRAAGIVADVGVLAKLACEDRLAEAVVTLGRPLGFMLATPIEVARGKDLGAPHVVEDKIDGIRAQIHVMGGGEVRIFARGKGSVTSAFPDLARPLRGMTTTAILDGEIVVVTPEGRPRPFSALQPRLKKTEPSLELLRKLPVRYLAYDILLADGESLLALPFLDRRARLAAWVENAKGPILLHESRPLVSEEALDTEFEEARARGHEGLVLKRLDAPYAAGVRGFAWLKVKKAFATLDVVVVGAERGHGKRAGALSDYTFAVRDDGELRTVGKAYSGLTDAEIATMTARLEGLAIAEEKRGWLPVRPEIVLEVAFDGLQQSARHSSGYALRFPRIAGIRDDKTPADASTLSEVRALYEAQVASGHREESASTKKRGRKSGRRPDIRKKTALAERQLKLFDDD